MAKQIVKNTGNQPIYLNLGVGTSMKIRARDTAEVEEVALQSPEMVFYRSRGHVIVLEKSEAPRPEKAKPREKGQSKETDKPREEGEQ